jgi:HEAT repeat protein
VDEVEKLIEQLKDEDDDVRSSAAEALEKIGDKRSVFPLIEMLSDPDEEVLEYTCMALGKIRDERAVLPLIEFIETSDSNEADIYFAIRALGQIGDERAIEPLIEMLKDPERRKSSARALGEICTKKSIEALIEVLQSENIEERNVAVSGLYRNVKHGDEHYQKIAEICSDIARCSAESRTLFDLINRDVGIHPDGSTAFSETPTPIIESTGRKVFYDPVLQEYYYIDEDGNEIDCDNSGRDLN